MPYTHTTKVGRWLVRDGGTMLTRKMADGTPLLSSEQLCKLELRAAITVFKEVTLVGSAELKFARKALGMRQTDLAGHLGINAETVSRWENGAETFKRPIQLAILALLEEYRSTGCVEPPIRSTRSRNRTLEAVK